MPAEERRASGAVLLARQLHRSTLLWLFGLEKTGDSTLFQLDLRATPLRELDLAARYILELIGVEVVVSDEALLTLLVSRFGARFPTTREFSDFTRGNLGEVNELDDPDAALLAWMEFEERLFMTLERHIVERVLTQGFMTDGKADVDSFVNFSLSILNRRKSRAGWALGNHVERILVRNKVQFEREVVTEGNSRPDFIFPSQKAYQDRSWPDATLSMLAVKTSCKDRWRQVLAEAERIRPKHLLTLEPGISRAQTEEMKKQDVQLVVPQGLQMTYSKAQQSELLNLAAFISSVKQHQN